MDEFIHSWAVQSFSSLGDVKDAHVVFSVARVVIASQMFAM